MVEHWFCKPDVVGSSPTVSLGGRPSKGRCRSGQSEQTVNLPGLALRGFESLPAQSRPPDGGLRYAGVAQLVEHLPSKQDVVGSSPIARYGRNDKLL